MTGYTMTLLANPSDPDEIQGTNADAEYTDGLYASIASGKAKLVIQKWNKESTEPTDWLGSSWAGATIEAENLRFAVELNVAGKLIYGSAGGGWAPTKTGKYRITFYLPDDSDVLISSDTYFADCGDKGAPVIKEPNDVDEGGTPIINLSFNLTYVDVTVE